MFHAQQLAPGKRLKCLRGFSLFLCLVMLLTGLSFGGAAVRAEAEDADTVTVTVNYVYAANQAMVTQPYRAQLALGSAFQKTLAVPKLLNYSVPADQAQGLGSGIDLSLDEESGEYALTFDLATVTEDVTVTLYYVAGTASYTVYHYYQNLEDDGYGDPLVVELTGDIDTYTQAMAENRPGFHCKGVPETAIAADGTTKVEIYYDRNYYTVTFDVNGGINGPEPIYARYGTTFQVSDIQSPTRAGCIFLGWGTPALSGTVEITEDVTYTAVWQPEHSQADYTIVLWGQNANDDEYSYLSSQEAWGSVGAEVTWNPSLLISHVHGEECLLICGEPEHTHDAGCCSLEEHTHEPACFTGVGSTARAGSGAPSNPTNGYVYRKARSWNEKVIYINGTWYDYTGSTATGSIAPAACGKTEHVHGNGCNHELCGLEAHTHSKDCYSCKLSDDPQYMSSIRPSEALWVFERSDTVTIGADGRTVLNVYFTRQEFTLHFRKAYSDTDNYGTITARWGQNIAAAYNAVVDEAGSSFWSRYSDAKGPYTNYIGVMPAENIIYYNRPQDGNQNTMYYYAEDLNGGYSEIFHVSFGGTYYVTVEDRYDFEGFTYNHGTDIGKDCNGAKFYYTRNSYALEFYSASNSTPDRTESVKYQSPLGEYDYAPTARPETMEADAVFVGWYQNPECTGEQYDLAAHTMPANDIVLYAKWVNGLYTVRTFTDETLQTLYTYPGYSGEQTNIEKYTLAAEPDAPEKDGYQFVGWFYRDGDAEKPFSFTMPITRNYDLYPKFSEPTVVPYTVHYYKAGTTEKVADDRTGYVLIGTTVTEKAKMGSELNLVDPALQSHFYPTNTSTSEIINRLGQEIIFYYTEAASVRYTVYYQDAEGRDLIPPVTKTTDYSTVTEQYEPIDGYAPRQYQITLDLSSEEDQNRIVFLYDRALVALTLRKSGWQETDENQTFLFRIRGAEAATEAVDLRVTLHGNGQTTLTGLPAGRYTVTEDTAWSWRYTPEEASQTIALSADGTVTFVNRRTEDQWLGGDDSRVNLFETNN